MIHDRKGFESKQERRHDLFSNLLEANDEDAEVTLSDSELLGMFCFGGLLHEYLRYWQATFSFSCWPVCVSQSSIIFFLLTIILQDTRSVYASGLSHMIMLTLVS